MRLNEIEELLFWDDRPSYPWSFFVRLHLTGVVDRSAFESAVTKVIHRHPLLRVLVKVARGRLYFEPQEDVFPQIDWIDIEPAEQLPETSYLDVTQEIGWRLVIRQGVREADVTLQVQHSVCDGLGAFQILEEILILYANEVSPHDVIELPELQEDLLKRRGNWGVTWKNWFRTMRNQWVGVKGVKQFLQRQPVPLVPTSPEIESADYPTRYPQTRFEWLDLEKSKSLIRLAKSKNCTVNDWLTTKIFMALGDWRRPKKNVDINQWIRMMVPVSLRGEHTLGMPTANIVSSIFLDRQDEQFQNAETLLRSVQTEMQLIKRHQLGLTFPYSLRLTRWAPGGLKKAARKDECTMSLIFTNPGRVFQCSVLPQNEIGLLQAGNLILNRPELVSPLRPYNLMTFSSIGYAGRIGVTVNFDHRVIDENDADSFWDMFVEGLLAQI